eukprot:COSAG01_NODE_16828_length_1200_cov_14.917348_1_plen_192_part_10
MQGNASQQPAQSGWPRSPVHIARHTSTDLYTRLGSSAQADRGGTEAHKPVSMSVETVESGLLDLVPHILDRSSSLYAPETYPLLRTVRKCNCQSETYQTLEDYGELWLKMFGASVVCGENFGVHERPLRKWRFFKCSGHRGGYGGACLPPPAFKLWISSIGRVGASATIYLQRICGSIMYGRVAVLPTPRKK